MDIISRFESHITFNDDTNCWLWDCQEDRYGQFWVYDRNISAHRFSFEYFNKVKLNKTDYICHLCNVKSCVNPNHLFLGDAEINHVHAVICGLDKKKDQRYNRSNTKEKTLPKGITYNIKRDSYHCSIRTSTKRFQTWKKSLADAIEWRLNMERVHWNNNSKQQEK